MKYLFVSEYLLLSETSSSESLSLFVSSLTFFVIINIKKETFKVGCWVDMFFYLHN